MIYADASFLVALFVDSDDHWHEAWSWWQKHRTSGIIVSRLALFEAQNTIQGWAVAKKCRPVEVRIALEGLKRAQIDGIVTRRSVAEHRLFPHAIRLSQHHTIACTFGALDILHVAAALELGCEVFLTFDQRQRDLAEAEGLQVHP